jgi:hypothetical protein
MVDALVFIYGLSNDGTFFQDRLGIFRPVPKIFPSNDTLNLLEPFFFIGKVKESPLCVLIFQKVP